MTLLHEIRTNSAEYPGVAYLVTTGYTRRIPPATPACDPSTDTIRIQVAFDADLEPMWLRQSSWGLGDRGEVTYRDGDQLTDPRWSVYVDRAALGLAQQLVPSMSVTDAADALRISPQRVRVLRERGKLDRGLDGGVTVASVQARMS